MIISASRRTDIPALYSEWLLNRLEAGIVMVLSPRVPGRLGRVELSEYEILADYFIENNGSEDEGVEKLTALIKAISAVAEIRGNHAN